MKKKGSFSYVYFYIFFLVIIIGLIYYQSFKSKNINENFISNKINNKDNDNNKVNLSCEVGDGNVYNCKSFKEKTITVKQNYPPLKYDKGIGPITSRGEVKFKTMFEEVPTVFCNPMLDAPKNNPTLTKEDSEKIPIVNISVYNVSEGGFNYIKNKVMKSGEDLNNIPVMSEDDKTKFSWLAISDPPKNPYQKVNSNT